MLLDGYDVCRLLVDLHQLEAHYMAFPTIGR